MTFLESGRAVAASAAAAAGLHTRNLAEHRRHNRLCVNDCASHADTTDPDWVGDMQRLARACGVPLVVTGKLDADTAGWVRTFQHAFALGQFRDVPLKVDGFPGIKTDAARRYCLAHSQGSALGPLVSDNFAFREFVSKNRKPVSRLRLDRDLVLGLQSLREFYGVPVKVISGYRDPVWNAVIGGAKASQHLLGKAADFRLVGATFVPLERHCSRWFNGIGAHRVSGRVSHVDVRSYRARWFYSGS